MSSKRLIIFDIDGTLLSTKDCHFHSLNNAIRKIAGDTHVISREDHINKFDGLPTTVKLDLLTQERGLSKDFHSAIFEEKQIATMEYIRKNIQPNTEYKRLFDKLTADGHSIAFATNCISDTAKVMIESLGLINWPLYTNESVTHPKPSPEIYLHIMAQHGSGPSETIIFEDSPHGIEAAHRSGAKVVCVNNPEDITETLLNESIRKSAIKNIRWSSSNINIVVPMAGMGSRFSNAGYLLPKPLIDVNGKPMIQQVIESIDVEGNYIFLVQKVHEEQYFVSRFLKAIVPECHIVYVDGLTDGAACTVLLAEEFINNEKQLLIVNSDQLIRWNSVKFFYKMNAKKADAGILTFKSSHPKWSYVRTVTDGSIVEVAEKKPISTDATVGIYYWKQGKEFIHYAKQMIANEIRVNNEFYIAPVYNEAINDTSREQAFKIAPYEVSYMQGIGTPEDLEIHHKLDGKRIALCISGQLRSFARTWQTMYENIVKPLNADVFLKVWDCKLNPYHYSFDQFDECKPEDAIKLCAPVRYEAEPFDDIRKQIYMNMAERMPNVVYEHQRGEQQVNYFSMFYNIMGCNQLKKDYEKEHGFTYDVVIRCRPDLYFQSPLLVDGIVANGVYMPVHSRHDGACDQFALGTSTSMDEYADCYKKLEELSETGVACNAEILLYNHLLRSNLEIRDSAVDFFIARS